MPDEATLEARERIAGLAAMHGMDGGAYEGLLDYTIELFEAEGLGAGYYGYHGILHELDVAYVTMLAAGADRDMSQSDMRHLYAAALLHDYDPQKSVDKPREAGAVGFVDSDARLRGLLDEASISPDAVCALISRTAYPWEGRSAEEGAAAIARRVPAGDLDRVMELGWFLSVSDRIAGYAAGGFQAGLEIAKKNAHALGWHPALLAQRSVTYFERLMGDDGEMMRRVVGLLPREMRRNLVENVTGFMDMRKREIRIQGEHLYENLRLVPSIERPGGLAGLEPDLGPILDELPAPLQINRGRLRESLEDERTILTTLRLGEGGRVVGFAKGGPLESYELRPEVSDDNYGRGNTVFLEPLAIRAGYWGLRGGSEMRHMFTMQACAKKYSYLTSFAHRDVIRRRVEGREGAEFVARLDPERWDYYRVGL